jgi:hypothetical protein
LGPFSAAGDDSDTVGAIYGSLAGAYYGLDGIPAEWRRQLAFGSLVEVGGCACLFVFLCVPLGPVVCGGSGKGPTPPVASYLPPLLAVWQAVATSLAAMASHVSTRDLPPGAALFAVPEEAVPATTLSALRLLDSLQRGCVAFEWTVF